jgi:phospholipid transport system substrate-binding protein
MSLQTIRQFAVGLFLLLAVAVNAQSSAEAKIAPDKLVEEISEALVSDIANYRDAINQADSEEQKAVMLADFYSRVAATLDPVVDFNWLSLNVMGDYRKKATTEQREQFMQVFKRGLVETYGRGLLTYSNQKIVVFPLEEGEKGKRKVVINQEIRGESQAYPLQYRMGLNRDGNWKVINVVINGINLGNTFRSQFVQAAAKYSGDLDQVIANWTVSES